MKTTMRYYLTSVRRASGQETNADKEVQKREYLYTVSGNVNSVATMENSKDLSQKFKNSTTI